MCSNFHILPIPIVSNLMNLYDFSPFCSSLGLPTWTTDGRVGGYSNVPLFNLI